MVGPTLPDCRRIDPRESMALGPLRSPHDVYALLAPSSTRLRYERAWLLLLTPAYRLASEGIVGNGTRYEVAIDLRWALRCVRLPGTPFCVLAHNHPNGSAWPSVADADLTREMRAAARAEGVELLDHVVLGRGEYFSFREAALWRTK